MNPEQAFSRKRKSPFRSDARHITQDDDDSSQSLIWTTRDIPKRIYEPIYLQARHMLLNEIVILTPNSTPISRGHFVNVAKMLQLPDANGLQAAIDAAGLALLATRFGSPEAQNLASAQYNTSIRYLRSQDIALNIQQSLACIALLSVYEILNADTTENLKSVLHLTGIIALIRTQARVSQQPLTGIELLISGTNSQSVPAPTSRKKFAGTLGSTLDTGDKDDSSDPHPSADLPLNELVSILPRLSNLFEEATTALRPEKSAFEAQLTKIRDEALTLRSELLGWYSKQPAMALPATVQRFTQPFIIHFPYMKEVICPVLRADSYTDQLIAHVWNTYRQCQMHLADLICRLNDVLSMNEKSGNIRRESKRLQDEIQGYINDIYASIPFMLAGDSISYCKPEGADWVMPKPPMLVGGLKLQWRLFTIATLESAPTDRKGSARDLLLWLADSLGIGQAKVLAQMDENPRGGITAKGDALSWTGFLI